MRVFRPAPLPGSTVLHEVLARHEDTGFVTNLEDKGVVKSSRRQKSLWRMLPPGAARRAPPAQFSGQPQSGIQPGPEKI